MKKNKKEQPTPPSPDVSQRVSSSWFSPRERLALIPALGRTTQARGGTLEGRAGLLPGTPVCDTPWPTRGSRGMEASARGVCAAGRGAPSPAAGTSPPAALPRVGSRRDREFGAGGAGPPGAQIPSRRPEGPVVRDAAIPGRGSGRQSRLLVSRVPARGQPRPRGAGCRGAGARLRAPPLGPDRAGRVHAGGGGGGGERGPCPLWLVTRLHGSGCQGCPETPRGHGKPRTRVESAW